MSTPTESKYLLEIHIIQCMKFKGVFAVIKDLLFDCNIYFDETGMKICNLDNSKVALVHFKAPHNAKAFSYYYCERPQVLGVSITALHKYLGHISQNNRYTLKLMVEKGKSHEMILEIASDDDTDTQRFYMKLLDLELDEGGLDGEVFNCIINIPSDKFQRYCRSHALVGDVMDIITVGDQVELCTEDSDGGDRTKSIIRTMDEDEEDDNNNNNNSDVDEEPESPPRPPPKRGSKAAAAAAAAAASASEDKKRTAIYLKDKDDPIAGRFALKFLQMFAKAQSLSPNVVIYFKKDYPLVLLYKMSELGELKFALAPRVAPTTL
jgi:proliferating cell nuclear antigen